MPFPSFLHSAPAFTPEARHDRLSVSAKRRHVRLFVVVAVWMLICGNNSAAVDVKDENAELLRSVEGTWRVTRSVTGAGTGRADTHWSWSQGTSQLLHLANGQLAVFHEAPELRTVTPLEEPGRFQLSPCFAAWLFDEQIAIRIDGDQLLVHTASPDRPPPPGEQVEIGSFTSGRDSTVYTLVRVPDVISTEPLPPVDGNLNPRLQGVWDFEVVRFRQPGNVIFHTLIIHGPDVYLVAMPRDVDPPHIPLPMPDAAVRKLPRMWKGRLSRLSAKQSPLATFIPALPPHDRESPDQQSEKPILDRIFRQVPVQYEFRFGENEVTVVRPESETSSLNTLSVYSSVLSPASREWMGIVDQITLLRHDQSPELFAAKRAAEQAEHDADIQLQAIRKEFLERPFLSRIGRARARTAFRNLMTRFPDTKAAAEAQAILDSVLKTK